jgi:uncharacterized protein
MKTMERRFVKGATVRAKQGEKPGIEGYGAVFGQEYVLYEDSNWRIVETIKPGAFTRVLKENQDTRCLFNHDPDNVLGRTTNRTLRMSQDDSGLHYENDLDTRTTVGQNVQAFVDRGDVTGCSFAFTISKQTWRDEKSVDGKTTISTREIEEIESLYDVGPVTYPAYDGTSVSPRSAELRSISSEGLPAEIKKRIRGLVERAKDDECVCRCVACARDNDCEKCVDHMVDCGDEENCRCMDKRSAQGDTIGGGKKCQCDCPECMVGDCVNCSEPDCADEDCDHDADGDRSALELMEMDARLRQLRPATS